jgi:hypothetical protein
MPKVYAIQESPGKNLTGALDYGEVQILFPGDQQLAFSPGPIVKELSFKLAKFTDEDFILLIGDPAIIGIACAVITEQCGGRFKLLKWDRQEARYYPIQVDLHAERREKAAREVVKPEE